MTVDRRYRTLMEERADALVSRLDGGAEADLSEITLHFSTQVAARVIGLTESDQEGMAHRLTGFFDQPEAMLSVERPTGLRRLTSTLLSVPALAKMAAFYLRDVRPAIRARRAEPQQDVISHLIEQDYSDTEILMECITYGAAGMVTTREFLQITTWHLLARPDLRAAFLAGDTAQRAALLHEVLRLEPVVGHLYRRTGAELVLTDGDVEHRIPAGARLDLYVRSANADPDHVTPDPLALRPGRDLPSGIRAEVMSFGDGPHRCPGNAVAMVESEVFLERLLARDVELVGGPRLEWEELIAGYAVRDLVLRDRGGEWVPPLAEEPVAEEPVGETGQMDDPAHDQAPGTPVGEPAADAVAPQDAVDLAHALFDLARQGDAARLGAYVDAGAPADLTDPQGNTLLMLAAYHGHADAVRALAGRGADVDRLNDRGQSPLAGAVFRGEDDVVAVLLEHGADPDAGQPTARQTAQMFGRTDLLDAPSGPA